MRKIPLSLTVAGFALLCMTAGAGAQSPSVEVNRDVLENTAIHRHYGAQKEKEQAAGENALTGLQGLTAADPVDAAPVDPVSSGTGAFLTGPEVSGEILDGAAPVLTDPMPRAEDAAADAEKLFEEMQGTETAPDAELAPETVINWVEEETPVREAAPVDVPPVEVPSVEVPSADPRLLKTQPDELPESLRREMMGVPAGDAEDHSAAPVTEPVAAPANTVKAEAEKPVQRPLRRPEAAKRQAMEKREAAGIVPDSAPVEDVAAEKLPLPEADLMPEASVAASAPAAVNMDVENAVSLPFDGNDSRITPDMETVLKDITARLAADNGLRVQLNAFASGEAGNQSSARRISLSRALSARDYLVEQGGITPTRMDVRALGDQTQKQPVDRIDFVFVE